MALPTDAGDNVAGAMHPDTSLSDAVTQVNRAVPGIPPQHALAAAQTPDPIEAAHAAAGLNILTSHLVAHQRMQNEGMIGAQGVMAPATLQKDITTPASSGRNVWNNVGDFFKQAAEGVVPLTETVLKDIGGVVTTAGSIIDPLEWFTGHNPLNSKERADTFNWGQHFGLGAATAVGGTVKGAANWVGSTGTDIARLPSRFLDNPQAVLDQFRHDIANDANIVGDFPQRLYRYYVQTVHDKGFAYASGQLFATIAAALATGGTGGLGEVAPEVANLAEDTSIASRLAGLNPRTQSAYDFYRTVADSPYTKAAAFPVKVALKPAGAIMHLASSTPGAITQAMLMAQSGADGSDAARWQATEHGAKWINPYGAQFATLGQFVMHLMGIDPNSWYGHIGSRMTDFYTNFLMPDPVGGAGNIFKDARSLDGASGLLHGLFSGTAIRSADDIDRIFKQYSQFRNTVDHIVGLSAGRLSELYKGKLPADMILELGNAKTREEVLDVLKKHAASAELTSSQMLTLGGYTRTKDALRAASLAERGEMPEGIKTPKEVLDYLVWATSPEFKKVGAIFAKGLAQRGFWIDSETGAMMTDKILRADASAVHVIQGRLRQAGMAEDVIAQVGKDLMVAADKEDHMAFMDIARNNQKTAWKGFLQANLDDPALADWVKALQDRSDQMIDDMLGTSGIGMDNIYTSERADGILVNTKDEPVAAAAANRAQRSSVPLLDAKSMRRAVDVLVKVGKDEMLTALSRPLAIAGKTDEAAVQAIRVALHASKDTLATFRDMIRNVFAEVPTPPPGLEGNDEQRLFAGSRINKYESVLQSVAAGPGDVADKLNQYRQWLITQSKTEDPVAQLEANLLSAMIDTHLLGRSVDYSKLTEAQLAYQRGTGELSAEAEDAYLKRYNELVNPYKNRNYRTSLAMRGDQIDHIINDLIFKPLTLSSPSWAWHVGASEAILNGFRYGPLNMFESRFASTIANKAMKYSLSEGVPYERVADAVSSLLQEFSPADIKALRENGLTELEREKLVEQGLNDSEIRATQQAVAQQGKRVIRGTLAGVGIGFRESVLKGLAGDAKAERLISDAIDLKLLHPGGIHPALSASHTAYVESNVADEGSYNLDENKKVEGVRRGRFGKQFTISNPTDFGHPNILQHFVGISLGTPEHQFTAKLFQEAINSMGEDAFIKALQDTRDGENVLYRKAQVIKDIEAKVADYLNKLPAGEQNSMLRTKYFSSNAKHFPDIKTPNQDFARVIVKENLNAWMSADRTMLHSPILNQIVNKDVRSVRWFKEYGKKVGPDNMPSNIVGPEIMVGSKRRLFAESLTRLSNLSHEKMLGPMVDYISRQPTYLLAYHREMEALRFTNGIFSNTAGEALDALKTERDAAHIRVNALSSEVGQAAQNFSDVSEVGHAKYQEFKQALNDFNEAQGRYDAAVVTHQQANERVASLALRRDAQTVTVREAKSASDKAEATHRANVRSLNTEINGLQRAADNVQRRMFKLDMFNVSEKEAFKEYNLTIRKLDREMVQAEKVLEANQWSSFTEGNTQWQEAQKNFEDFKKSYEQRKSAAAALRDKKAAQWESKPIPDELAQQFQETQDQLKAAKSAYAGKVAQSDSVRELAAVKHRYEQAMMVRAKNDIAIARGKVSEVSKNITAAKRETAKAQKVTNNIKSQVQSIHDVLDSLEEELLQAIDRLPENQDKIKNEIGRIAELNEQIENHVVQPGMIHEAQAQVLAEQRAARKMIGEVHNPADRTNFEQAMTRFSPFYFAQNQAWRRAFRLLAENPGAFERYIKLTMAATNYAHLHQVNGIPMVEAPVSELGGINLFTHGFTFGLDLSSLKSVTPFGMSGDTSWAGLFHETGLPALGPVASIPLQGMTDGFGWLAGQMFGKDATTKVRDAAQFVEGPVAASQGIASQMLPNTLFKNIIQGVTSYLGDASTNVIGGSYISTRLQVYKEMTQETLDGIGKQLLNKGFGNYNAATMQYVYKNNPALFATYEQMAFSIKANSDPNFLQRIADKANNATAQLWTLKTLAGFFGPTSISLESPGAVRSNELQQDVSKLGLTDGYAAYNKKHPLDSMTSVFTTSHPHGVSYTANQEALDFLRNNGDWTSNNQNIASFFIPRPANSPFSQAAYSLEQHMGLVGRQNMSGLAKQEMIVWGNNWYYGSLVPAIEDQVNAGKITQYSGSSILKQERAAYSTMNPTWSAYYGSERQGTANAGYRALNNFYNTPGPKYTYEGATLPAVVSQWPESSQKAAVYIHNLLNSYSRYVDAASNLTGNEKYNLETQWYDFCKQEMKDRPELSSVITTIFNRLPSSGVPNA